MKQMIIAPPELEPYEKQRYINDLEYRLLVDLESSSERHARLRHLLNLAPYPPED